jgi:murein DD-endopeptidase MepM/ murein hydrolase activator NlpD
MRRAFVCLAVAAATLAGPTLFANGQDTRTTARASATVLTSYGDAQGEIVNDTAGTTRRTTLADYDADGVQIDDGEAAATVSDDLGARASVTVSHITLLDGRITLGGVRRVAVMRPDGHVRYAGEASGVIVDGQYFDKIRGEQTIQFKDGSVDFNTGNTGLHLMFDDGVGADAQDLRIAVARTMQKTESLSTPTPEPTTTPTPASTSTRAPVFPSLSPTAAPSGTTPTPTPKTKAEIQAALVRAANKRFRHGRWIFPVAADARVADNYGAVRAAPINTHEGVDIFAPFGSPVVAVRDGTLSLVGTLPIAGNRLWLTTGDGDAFFYAHLSSFAPVAKAGAEVKAGEVLGYAGNTGDAEPTPPHLHFEVHPGGEPKPSVDPYPIVTRWQDAAGGHRTASTDRPGSLVTVRDFLAP